MRFDIVIPCYNKKPDIVARCFQSIKEAYVTYGKPLNVHVCVIDDASTEYSEELQDLTKAIFDESGIEWIYRRNDENLGCFMSRLIGLHKLVSTPVTMPFFEPSSWTVHLDPDDTFLPNFFEHLVPFIKEEAKGNIQCIPIEAEVYSVKGDYWDNDNQSYMKDFPSLRAVADAGLTVWNSVCDKIWSTSFFYNTIVFPILKAINEFSYPLRGINYMEDFLFSMIYLQFDCNIKYFPVRIERAYMDEEGSSCNETELGEEAKDKIRECMARIRIAIEFLIAHTNFKIDTLTAVRYAHQMDRLIK